jgi:hypothetical protein
MMSGEDRILAVAAVCDRRRLNSRHPARYWRASFVRKPQIKPCSPALQSSRQSSLIKPFRASTRSIPSLLVLKNPHLLNPPPSNPVKPSQSVLQSLSSCHGSGPHRYILWSIRPNAQPIVLFHLRPPPIPLPSAIPVKPTRPIRPIRPISEIRNPKSQPVPPRST